jgi:hypothetical protein
MLSTLTGRVMKRFVWVDPKARDTRGLKDWIAPAENHVAALPAKEKQRKSAA